VEERLLNPTVAIILVVAFGLAWIYFGFVLGKRSKGAEGFMLAGRNVGLALGTATAMATWVTSNTIMLAPKFALQMGIWGILAYCTASFSLFLFAPMSKRIKELLPNAFTSGDFLRLRYGKSTWILFLIISMVYSLAWLVSMAMAGGIVLQALSGLPYMIGMSAILFVCVAYTIVGGMYAVIGTDFIQSVIILIGVVVVGVALLNHTGMEQIYTSIETQRPQLFKLFMPVALISLFNNMFFGFGEVFHNNVWWSRAFAIREKYTMKAYFLSGLMWFPIPIAAGFIGLAAPALGVDLTNSDMVGPLVAATALGKAGALIIFVVVYCSLASSIDSLLAATSDLVSEDILGKLFKRNPNEQDRKKINVAVILGLGIFTWALAATQAGDLIQVLFLSGPFVASLIFPIVCGLYWEKVTSRVSNIAILLGAGIGLWTYFNVGWYAASLMAALISGTITMVGAQFNNEKFNWERLKES